MTDIDISQPTSTPSTSQDEITEYVHQFVDDIFTNIINKIAISQPIPSPIQPPDPNLQRCERDGDMLIYQCPHCNFSITTHIQELACCIFRHGFDKSTQQQVPPHEPKQSCDLLATNPNIVGCCKPYRIINKQPDPNDVEPEKIRYYVEVCEYI
jgi:hypothetical protein